MSELFLLPKKPFNCIQPYVPLSHGVPRVDDLRVVGGIVYGIKNGLPWNDALRGYGPPKTLMGGVYHKKAFPAFARAFNSRACLEVIQIGAAKPPAIVTLQKDIDARVERAVVP